MSSSKPIDRYEVLISGAGGQGVVLVGRLLAASALIQSYQVAQTISYGPESRGGVSESEVIISSYFIDYPGVIEPNFVIALTQEAAEKWAGRLSDEGVLLLDGTWVENIPETRARQTYVIELSKDASVRFGRAIYANLVAVGFFTGKSGILEPEAVRRAISEEIPEKYMVQNLKAFEYGLELARTAEKVLVSP